MLKVCIIGCGMIARSAHIPAYKYHSEYYEVTAVCDMFEESAKAVAEEFSIPNYYTDAETMLKEQKADVVSVCSPNMSHKHFVMLALSYGANVLCEKPLAFNYNDAKEMFDLAKKQNKVLMACQTARFTPDRKKAIEIIEKDTLGEVYYAEVSRIRRRGIPTWGKFHLKEYSGGGALVDIGVHIMDSALWLMGNPEPTTVKANMLKVHTEELGSAKSSGALKENVVTNNFNPDEMNVESFASGTVSFKNGATLSFKVSWAANLAEANNIVLSGSKAGIDTENHIMYQGENGISEYSTQPEKLSNEAFYGHFYVIENLALVLTKGEEMIIKPEETLNVTAVLQAAYLSAEENREVKIEEIKGDNFEN